jgi:hypothetical protein
VLCSEIYSNTDWLTLGSQSVLHDALKCKIALKSIGQRFRVTLSRSAGEWQFLSETNHPTKSHTLFGGVSN